MTSIKGQVAEYSETAKLSLTLLSYEVIVRGLSIREHNVVVRSGLVLHLYVRHDTSNIMDGNIP